MLAVHSFVEGYLRERCEPEDPTDDRFYAFMEAFRTELLERAGGGYVQGLDLISLMCRDHDLTNAVRHRFVPLSTEYARAATQQLCRFCALAGIGGGEALSKVERYLEAWKDRRSGGELRGELAELGFKLRTEQTRSKRLTERVEELENVEAQFDHLKEQRRILERKIDEAEKGRAAKDEKIDELRAERSRLNEELRSLKRRTDELDDAKEYLRTLSRLTVYTRTRLDYERMITRLTVEQKTILSQISLNDDFLVKGAAGTGKTLVLLNAIEKAKGRGTDGAGAQDDLDLGELRGSVALLTYTTTLVKYDKYLSRLMSQGRLAESDRIATADSFLLERLREIEPDASIDYSGKNALEIAASIPSVGLDPKEVASEAEQFIWANDVAREEYVDQAIERRGRKKPIPGSARAAMWDAVSALAAAMEPARVYSKNYATVKLVRYASAEGRKGAITRFDHVFIDEAQDLSAAALKALKLCARRCVVLAGDADQSIYQPGFSFRRAGIDISGRTRILKTNFRNTVQIHDLAERYRSRVPGADQESQPEAFRDGPAPELFQAENRKELLELMLGRVRLFTERLGYEPENIGLLVPLNEDIGVIRERFGAAGYAVSDIKDKDFDFETTGSIRISTLHSAKGLDFPVVLLLANRSPYLSADYEDAAIERMTRNLIYVSVTRAMEHLNVFALEHPSSKPLADLVAAFGAEGEAPNAAG